MTARWRSTQVESCWVRRFYVLSPGATAYHEGMLVARCSYTLKISHGVLCHFEAFFRAARPCKDLASGGSSGRGQTDVGTHTFTLPASLASASSLLAAAAPSHGAAARRRAAQRAARRWQLACVGGRRAAVQCTSAGGVCGLPTRVIERRRAPTTRMRSSLPGGTLGMTHREGSLTESAQPRRAHPQHARVWRHVAAGGGHARVRPAARLVERRPRRVGDARRVRRRVPRLRRLAVIHGTDTMCGRRTRARRAIVVPPRFTHTLSPGAIRRRRCRSCSRASASPSSSPAA